MRRFLLFSALLLALTTPWVGLVGVAAQDADDDEFDTLPTSVTPLTRASVDDPDTVLGLGEDHSPAPIDVFAGAEAESVIVDGAVIEQEEAEAAAENDPETAEGGATTETTGRQPKKAKTRARASREWACGESTVGCSLSIALAFW